MIRDRFTGSVEAFTRWNASASGHHGEHSKHKIPDDALISLKDNVSLLFVCSMLQKVVCQLSDSVVTKISACYLVLFWKTTSNISARK